MRKTSRITAFLILAILSGCRVGEWGTQTATSPHGAQIELGAGFTETTGELLWVRQDGIVFLSEGVATLGRWDALPGLSFLNHPVADLPSGTTPSDDHREEMRLVARYPYGISDEQVRRLLDALDQNDLAELP